MKNILLTLNLVIFALIQSIGQDASVVSDTLKRETIQLLKKGKFSFGEIQSKPIEKHWLGLGYGYTDEFKTALATNPYAARELRKSYQYQTLETGGRVIFYSLIVKSFIYTIKKAKQVRDGDYDGNPTPVVDAINLTVSAGISYYGSIKKRKQIKKAVDVFNSEFINN